MTIPVKRDQYNLNPNRCLECGKEILCIPGKNLTEVKSKKFCNNSCAAKYNNARKKKKAYFCKSCGAVIGYGEKYDRRKFCDKCNPSNVDWSKVTLRDIRSPRTYQANSRVRKLAQQIYAKSNRPKQCINCGYFTHYEICHIKAISEFDLDTPISTINDINNLMALCPNCHWEFDNGFLTLEDIRGCSSEG